MVWGLGWMGADRMGMGNSKFRRRGWGLGWGEGKLNEERVNAVTIHLNLILPTFTSFFHHHTIYIYPVQHNHAKLPRNPNPYPRNHHPGHVQKTTCWSIRYGNVHTCREATWSCICISGLYFIWFCGGCFLVRGCVCVCVPRKFYYRLIIPQLYCTSSIMTVLSLCLSCVCLVWLMISFWVHVNYQYW